MPEIRITEDGDRIAVTSPYNPEFASTAKRLAGRWDAEKKVWHFDGRNEQQVRTALVQHYGTDGDTIPDLVTIDLQIKGGAHTSPITWHGRIIAKAFGRDSGAKLGDGVVLVSGSFDSSGSVKNWYTATNYSGAVVRLHDIPRHLLDAEPEPPRYGSGPDFEILDIREPDAPADPANAEQLREELARIEARAAAIRKELGGDPA